MTPRRLTEPEHRALVQFHATPICGVCSRTPRRVEHVTAEEWARIEAGYRARFAALADGSNGGGPRERAKATQPVPEMPARTDERACGRDSYERRRAAR